MQDPEATATTLRALNALGLRLAIDDFGTGYFSLSYLQRFPLDTLKIDRSFVEGLGNDGQNEAIVLSVVALAGALNLSTTGEGVGTASQQAHLQALGRDMGQGILFARPLPAGDIEVLLDGKAELPRAAWSSYDCRLGCPPQPSLFYRVGEVPAAFDGARNW